MDVSNDGYPTMEVSNEMGGIWWSDPMMEVSDDDGIPSATEKKKIQKSQQ